MRALALLGLPLEKPTFPAILQCPHCQKNTLYVFDDILTDGLWLNCAGCSIHGDIITFGTNLWNISLPDTLTKFSDSGIITENDANRVAGDYARATSKYAAAESFWATAESQIWDHGDDFVACRLRDIGVKNEIEGCYGLVGVATYDQIAKICSEMGRTKPPRLRADGAFIVFPFYDLPGRLTGFLLQQYGKEEETKQTFISLSKYLRQKPEAGYFLLKAIIGPAPERLKGTQFVSDDPLWALQKQCEYLSIHPQTIPLGASYSGPEAESYGASWAAIPTGARIFHGATASAELISRACNAKGYTAVMPLKMPVRKPSGINSITQAVFGRLGNMRVNAKTWQHALRDAVTGVSELNAQAFMQKLTIPHDRLGVFIDKHAEHFSKEFKTRVLSSVKMALAAPTRTAKRRIIIERETGWWNQTGQQISNARVAIHKVLQADTGDKVYSGSVYMDDQEYAFTDSARRIERMGLLAYAAAIMAPHGKLVIFDRSWNKSSHMMALQLRPPKLVNITTKAGWDENTNTFKLGKYELTHGGEIKHNAGWASRKDSKLFPEPAPIAPLSLRSLLTPAHENSFIWAFTAAVLGNLIAPILRKDHFATAILDKNFDLACRIGDRLGCAFEKTTVLQRQNSHNFLNSITRNAVWPVLGCSAFNDNVFGPHVPKYFNCPLFLRLPQPTIVSSLSYGWQAIQETTTRLQYDLDALDHVLPAYIQRALKTRMHTFSAATNIHATVLQDVHKWMLETYGAAFNLPHAQHLMLYPSDAHTALLQEINNAVLSGKLRILPVPRASKQPTNYILRKKEHWWLNRRAVDRYFYSAQSVMPNWLAIIDLLQEEGVYVGEEIVHNMAGILIKAEWCDQFLTPEETTLKKEIS